MTLASGIKLGRYEIRSKIGEGGMGEVYLAQDTELDRKVALKILPADVASNRNRIDRFVREAKSAAALSHPNIAQIFEIGEDQGTHYIAMEFIEGVTLLELIHREPAELRKLLRYLQHVAEGLAKAHSAGIIHRDLKPDNIMVTYEGHAKILDFGLAKLIEPTVSTSQKADHLEGGRDDRPATEIATAIMQPHSTPGMILGTCGYMSPEQAQGKISQIDHRSDIFSFGCILYEAITQSKAFPGKDVIDTLNKVIREPVPSIANFNPSAPSDLQRIVRQCLAKDPEERYQTIKDVAIELKEVRRELQSTEEHTTAAPSVVMSAILENEPVLVSRLASNTPTELQRIVRKSSAKDRDERYQTARDLLIDPNSVSRGFQLESSASRRSHRIRKLLATAGVLIGLLLIAFVGLYFIRPRASTTPPPLIAIPLTTDPGFEGMPSFSPDGNYVAFIAGGGEPEKDVDLYVKQIGGGPPLRLTSGPAVEEFPAWSPDNRAIAFVRQGEKLEVFLISPFGGPERKLAEITADTSTSLFSWVPPYLSWTPDSKYLVTMDRLSPDEPYGLFVLSVATGEKRRLTTPPAPATADGNPAISPDGRTLAFVRVVAEGSTQVWVLPLSANYGPAGEVRRLDLPQQFLTSPAWTADGREIVYSASDQWAAGETRLWRVPVSGVERPQPLATVGENGFQATISREGHRLVYADLKYVDDIWRAEVTGPSKSSPPVKLIASTQRDYSPQYSPDGSKITFASDRSGHSEIWVCKSDGSSQVQLTTLESFSGSPQWFPDGRRIVFDVHREDQSDIYVTDIESRVPRRLANNPSDNVTPSVSHDGKWIYFSSKRSGRFEIWRMLAEGGEAAQVTYNGGLRPFESADGKVIYYAKAPGETEVWKVPASGGDETRVLGPVLAFQFAVVPNGIYFIESGTRVYAGSRGTSLKFYNFGRGTTERVVDIKLDPTNGLSVSPDGRYGLMTLVDPFHICDLKLVENFQ